MKNATYILLILLLVGIFANASTASEYLKTDQDNAILLKNAVFDTSKQSIVPANAEFATSQYSTDTEEYYILQFRGNVLEKWKQTVKNTGAVFFDYVPNNAFIVRMNSSVKSQVEAMDIVQWVGIYQPSYKISPVFPASSITATTTTTTLNSNEDISDIIVMLFDSKHNAQVTSEIENLGGEIVDNSGKIMRVRIATSKLSDIAAMNGVSWIEKYVQPVIFNDVAANITNVSYVQNAHGLNGSGQIVAVADSGLDTGVDNHSVDGDIHLDFDNRVTFFNYYGSSPNDNNGHGTHVTGSVAGDGSESGGLYKGMAPDASIVFQGIGDDAGSNVLGFNNLTEIFSDAYNAGARIHSNSWGSVSNGIYTDLSQETDQFAWDNKDFLIVFAAGNSGPNETTIASPGTSKNAITIGASQSSREGDIDQIASFSSRGLTDDGRIKPDLVAPGTYIISTKSSIGSASYPWGVVDRYYAYDSGTSMATPITAGTAALVRQYYMDNESLSSPSAALIKATLINGAANMGLSTNDQGWGRVDIGNSLFPTSSHAIHYYDNISLTTSQSWNVSYHINENRIPLKISLVWTDRPSAPFAGKTLVNDLDLNVTGPDGNYLGNGGDSINNVEQVKITSPPVGLYTITINGTNIPNGSQPFALVMSWGLDVYSPSVTNEFPANNSYINNSTTPVSINITDAGSGINLSSIEMLINDTPVIFTNISINNGYRIENITSTPYNDGLVNVSVTASDNASNSLTYNWSFIIDTTMPVITDATATPSEIEANETDNTLLNVTATDLHDIASVSVNLSSIGGLSDQPMSNNSGVWQFTTNTTTVGTFELPVNVTDNAGNSNTSINISLNATDTTPPAIADATANPPAIVANGTDNTLLNLTTTDLHGITSVSINLSAIGGSSTQAMVNNSGVWQFTTNTNVSGKNGTLINLPLNVTDGEGNSNTSYNIALGLKLKEVISAGNLTPFNVTVNETKLNVTVLVPADTNLSSGILTAAPVTPPSIPDGFEYGGVAVDLNGLIFNKSLTITLEYSAATQNQTKLKLWFYNTTTDKWEMIEGSTVNTTAHTVSGNVNHFTVFAPLADITPPTISITSPTGGYSTTASTITVSGTVNGTGSLPVVTVNDINASTTLIDFNGTFTVASVPISLGTNTINANVTDAAGNVDSTSISVTRTSPASPSSGGGGGGGGGNSGEAYGNIEFKDVSRVYISANTDASFTFNEAGNDIQSINYKALTSAGYITATVEVLKDTSALVKQAPSGKVYKNMNIWLGKAGYATEHNIENPVIGFKVQRSWIQDNSINENSIKLNRYSDDVWTALPTTKTDEDATYLYFESQTPGFSPFAIAAQEKMISSQVSIKSETAADSLSPVEETPVETTTTTLATETKSVEGSSIGKYTLIVALILIIIAGAYMYKRKQQE